MRDMQEVVGAQSNEDRDAQTFNRTKSDQQIPEC